MIALCEHPYACNSCPFHLCYLIHHIQLQMLFSSYILLPCIFEINCRHQYDVIYSICLITQPMFEKRKR